MTRTVVILGAAGRAANETGRAFVDHGFRVKAVTRDGRSVLPGATAVAADGADASQLAKAIEGADFVLNGLNPPYTEWAEKAVPIARNVAQALRGSGATHLFIGNVYAFGSPMPRHLRESTPERPSTEKGRIRQEMEALFRQESEAFGTQTIVLRAGDFFGAGSGSWFDQALASKLHKGVFTAPGPMDLSHAWAYLPDLAQAFVAAARSADRLPRFDALHFPGHTVTLADMKAAIEQATGKSLATSTMPWWAIRAMGLVNPMMREIAAMSYQWREPHELESDRINALLGPLPNTPLTEAVARSLEMLKLTKLAA